MQWQLIGCCVGAQVAVPPLQPALRSVVVIFFASLFAFMSLLAALVIAGARFGTYL